MNWRNPGTLDYCPKCLKAVARQEPTRAQQEARARETARKRQRVEETLAWVDSFKSSRGCLRCEETDPRALDCHHRDPAAKDINVSALVRRRPNLAIVAKELMKCDVICASCHRKEHRPPREVARVPRVPRVTAQTDSVLADLLATPPGSVKVLELRRVSLVEALKNTKDSLEALHSVGVTTREASKQRSELDDRRRSLSLALMKLDAEISSLPSLEQPTAKAAEDLP